MQLHRVDLNLLVVFDAIYSEGSITRAAEKLHLSQPAVSHALNRLRELLDDPLFERNGRKMIPTPKARNLITTVQRSLRDLQIMINGIELFDPASSEKTFTIGMRDLLEVNVLPTLVEQVCSTAPTLKLSSVRHNRNELESELAFGELDLAIDVLCPISGEIHYQRIVQDRVVALARKNNPNLKRKLSLDKYLAMGHIQLSSRRSGQSFEDLELSRQGIQRPIRIRCQNVLAAVRIVSQTDFILTIAESTALSLAQQFDLKIFELPFIQTAFDAYIYWHQNVTNDPGNSWLREQIMQAFQQNNHY